MRVKESLLKNQDKDQPSTYMMEVRRENLEPAKLSET